MHHVKMFFDIFYNFRLCLYFVKKNSILAAFEQVNTILRKSKKNGPNSRDPVPLSAGTTALHSLYRNYLFIKCR